MNLQQKMPTTADEFLRWNEGREGKREFVRGRVVEMMINVTRNHVDIATNLLLALRQQLDRKAFSVGSADFGVRTPDGIRYPDVFVDTVAVDGRSLATTSPLLIAEILSKSSIADDFGPKARDYQGLSSLQHYLTLSQDEVRLWAWSRTGDGSWKEPEIFEAGTVLLVIDGIPVSVDLPSLYAGIATVRTVS